MLVHLEDRNYEAGPITKVTLTKDCGEISDGLEFNDVKPLEDREGELFSIQGRGKMPEKMRDDELGISNHKRPRVSDYEAHNEDSDARPHPNLMRP